MDDIATAVRPARPAVEFTEDAISWLCDWQREGHPCALVTVTGIAGSAPRPVGSQMAVRADNLYAGHITAGCAEAAIVAQAVEQIEAQECATHRYGKGSKFRDIELPCGSGIDVHFDPLIDTAILHELQQLMRQRVACQLVMDAEGRRHVVRRAPPGAYSSLYADGDEFVRTYLPTTRVMIAGKGPMVPAMARVAKSTGWEAFVASPDDSALRGLDTLTDGRQHLKTADGFDVGAIDAFTACVVLFHDHDWEPPILKRMLETPAFYVGALGSRRTHALRCKALTELGVAPDQIARIRGPVGLDIGGRNPPEIALSIAAEILKHSRESA